MDLVGSVTWILARPKWECQKSEISQARPEASWLLGDCLTSASTARCDRLLVMSELAGETCFVWVPYLTKVRVLCVLHRRRHT